MAYPKLKNVGITKTNTPCVKYNSYEYRPIASNIASTGFKHRCIKTENMETANKQDNNPFNKFLNNSSSGLPKTK